MRKPATVLLAFAATAVVSSVAAGAIGVRALSPKATYTALLTKAFPDSQLPKGFKSAKISHYAPSANAKKHHVIGEVDVSVTGPDPNDVVEYAVFPSAADALADLKSQNLSSGGAHYKLVGRVPGYSLTSEWLNGSVTGQNSAGATVTYGLTVLFVQQGNVFIASLSSSAKSKTSGDVAAATALLKAAVTHLARVSP